MTPMIVLSYVIAFALGAAAAFLLTAFIDHRRRVAADKAGARLVDVNRFGVWQDVDPNREPTELGQPAVAETPDAETIRRLHP